MKVLIAIDEPNFAKAIAEFVNTHKWDVDTDFEVLSVIEPLKIGSVMAVLPGPVLDEMLEKRKEETAQVVENFVRSISRTVPRTKIRKQIIEGFPTDEIMKEVTREKPEMLIVGSHGKHGIERIILGSVSMFLVSHAPCSVVVIRPMEVSKESKKIA